MGRWAWAWALVLSVGVCARTMAAVRLAEEEECKEDVRTLCKDEMRTNLALLECLQNQRRDLQDVVSDKCNHLLWNYKMNLTRSGHIEELAKGVCEDELKENEDCRPGSEPGHTISCMTEKLGQIKNERCRQYLGRLAAIVFSDFRYVQHMVVDCQEEIQKFSCGRVEGQRGSQQGGRGGQRGEEEEDQSSPRYVHSQGATIECLSVHAGELGEACHKQILRLAELQSDDFHMDRALFFACREDREKFCEKLRSGEGRVYRCLIKHKTDRGMSKECGEQLSRRQKLTVLDYRVNRGLVRACRGAIQEHGCQRGNAGRDHNVKLIKILLCLEDAVRQGANIDGSCRDEMLAHRRQLMEDHKLSQELVDSCHEELQTLCHGGVAGEGGGRTLHCLMKHARSHKMRNKMSEQCKRELEKVVRETDAGEDWRVDPVLHEACHIVVDSACKDMMGGSARVMRCLMRHLETPEMTVECEAALLEIQYFVSRDWKLDPQVYSACRSDATRLCHAKKDWADSGSGNDGAQVLPCLFRYVYHPTTELRLTPLCGQEVQRVMHERAAYVELHPDIEAMCIQDLAVHCSSRTGPSEEMTCLQSNLEKLRKECKDVVSNYTEAEAKDVKLNSELSTHCAVTIAKVCSEGVQQRMSGEGDGLLNCLIRHKNTMAMQGQLKCRTVIEHFQLLSLKDYTFSPRFKEACQGDVATLCSRNKPKNKADVIECLSGLVRQAVLKDMTHQVSRGCRQQLRQQLLQRHENIHLDPMLKNACEEDLTRFCKHVNFGRGAVLECLREHKGNLAPTCHRQLFVREQEELQDPGTDVVLMAACRHMVEQHCQSVASEKLLQCLKINKESANFDGGCRAVVMRRLVEQTTDTRLNPELLHACRHDMAKFCSSLFDRSNTSSVELNGLLTECLKEQLPTRKLSTTCRSRVVALARTAALNYKMDPILVEKCRRDMNVLCPDESEQHMEECLKLAFQQRRVEADECRLHIAHIIETQRADIAADPALNQVCGVDDHKFCSEMEIGLHFSCLLDVLERNAQGLNPDCRETLRKRQEMYSAAMKITNIGSVSDLVWHVNESSERTYLLLVLMVLVGCIFIGGLFCGRVTKRTKFLKDR